MFPLSVVHPAHAAHTTTWHRWRRIFLRPVSDHGLGRYQEAGNRRRVLKGDPHDLRWIDNAGAQHIDVLLGLGVKAERLRFVFKDLADNEGAFDAGVLNNLPDRGLNRPQDEIDARLDIGIFVAELADRRLSAQ